MHNKADKTTRTQITGSVPRDVTLLQLMPRTRAGQPMHLYHRSVKGLFLSQSKSQQ